MKVNTITLPTVASLMLIMTPALSKSQLISWLRPIALKNNLKNFNISITGSSKKGDGYLGDISFVEVQSKDGKTYSFVVKSGKNGPLIRDNFPIRSAFKNEIFVYNEVFPQFLHFQREKNVKNPFHNFAQCYETQIYEDMEVLVLENLKNSGYALWDRTVGMNREHVVEILKNYGKLHAISYALKDQKPELFHNLASNLKDIYIHMFEGFKDMDIGMFNDIIKAAKTKGFDDIVEKSIFLDKHIVKIHELRGTQNPYAVIIHGDCWTSNYMFKYKDNNRTKPGKVCFLDWQMCRLMSPVYDLSYFLFTSCNPELLQDFDELNQIYYKSLSDFMRELGSDPEKLFPYEELRKQWKDYGKFGLIMMSWILKVSLSESDEVKDLLEVILSASDSRDRFSYTVKNIQEYERRSLAVMRVAIDKELV